MLDQLLRWTWQAPTTTLLPDIDEAPLMAAERSDNRTFVWRRGRADVTLHRAANSWCVIYSVTGRLLGPRKILYRAYHTEIRLAAWDFMARVIQASKDEEEGVRMGRCAVRWMTEAGGNGGPIRST